MGHWTLAERRRFIEMKYLVQQQSFTIVRMIMLFVFVGACAVVKIDESECQTSAARLNHQTQLQDVSYKIPDSSELNLTHAEIVSAEMMKSIGTVGLLVSLTFEDDSTRSGVCTGVIVGKNLVVTAAHCFTEARRGKVKEIGGFIEVTHSINFRDKIGIAFERISLHPQWNGLFHDLALVQLTQDLPAHYLGVSFIKDVNLISRGERVTLFGYGITGDGRADVGVLRAAESTFSGFIDKVNYPKTIIENQIRVKNESKTPSQACTGDSGGPAFLKNTGQLLGLVSGMHLSIQKSLECSSGDANYTLLAPYLDWIQTTSRMLLNANDQFVSVANLARSSIEEKNANALGFQVLPTNEMVEWERQNNLAKSNDKSSNAEECR